MSFEQLILAALRPHASTTPTQRAQGEQFCTNLKVQPDGWKTCLSQIHQHINGAQEVRFWCFAVLLHHVKTRYIEFPEEDRVAVRQFMLQWLRQVVPTIPHSYESKNTLAAILIELVRYDFPERWATLFTDLMGIVTGDGGAGSVNVDVAEVVVRMMKLVPLEVVQGDDRRPAAVLKHDRVVKDTMYDHVMGDMVALLHRLVCMCVEARERADIAALCLEAMAMNTSWMNINLVANPTVMRTLCDLLQMPELQVQACKCLTEIVRKRMEPGAKSAMLLQLRILDTLSQLNLNSYPEAFAIEVATLVAVLGQDYLNIFQEVKSTPNGAAQMQVNLPEIWARAEHTMQALLSMASIPSYQVFWRLVPFISAYLRALRSEQLRLAGEHTRTPSNGPPNAGLGYHPQQAPQQELPSGAGLGQAQIENLAKLFALVGQKMVFPEWFEHEDKDEPEVEFQRFRLELRPVLQKLMDCHPQMAVEMLNRRVRDTLANLQQLGYGDIEVTLQLLMELPHVVRDIRSRTREEPFQSMIGSVLSSAISHCPHRAIAIAYFRMASRFVFFLGSHEQLIEPVLASFLDARGMHNANPVVRARACTEFERLMRHSGGFRQKYRPFVDTALSSLQGLIQPVLSRVQGVHSGERVVSFSECQKLCECVGLLISSSVTREQCPEYVRTVILTFRRQLESGLAQRDRWMSSDPQLAGKRFSQVIDAIACVTKPLTSDAELVSDVLSNTLEMVLQVYQLLPEHEFVRSKTTIFLHRMIDCLRSKLIPYLPHVLPLMIRTADPSNLNPVMELLCQCARLCRADLAPVMDACLLPVLGKTEQCLQYFWAQINNSSTANVVAAHATEREAFADLRRHYYDLIKDIVSCDLVGVLTSPTNVQHTAKILATVIEGARDLSNQSTQRQCFQTLDALVDAYAKNNVVPPPAMMQFFLSNVHNTCFEVPLHADFDLGDAQCNNVLRTIVQVQFTLGKLGATYHNHLGNFLLQHMGLPQALAEEYVRLVTSGAPKQLLSALRTVVRERRAQLGLSVG